MQVPEKNGGDDGTRTRGLCREQKNLTHTCAYTKTCEACRLPSFHTVYEVIDGSDLTPHYGKRPSYVTVSEAPSNLGSSDYLVGVVNGWMRPLTAEEDAELQSAQLRHKKTA